MSPESILEAVLKITDPAEQTAFLDAACGEDMKLRQEIELLLLAHAASGDFMNRSALPQGATQADIITRSNNQKELTPGTIIAERYTLEQKLGEGGMGEVWVARQREPIKRRVALKLIKPGMDSRSVVQRFEQERQALAMMDHPNIAKVHDGGVTSDHRPFFVMELVNGMPLTRFCDSAKLTTRQRLELFVPICQGVQHAHNKGIVHRDLKPGNILVTMIDGKPMPKIIDFGVAKATGGKLTDESMVTQFGAVIGTLEYMAPEQAGFSGQDVDTRADLYSLGVILYELLSGLRPFDMKRLRHAALDEVIRILREEDPPSLASRLSTDESLPSVAAVRGTEPKRLLAMIKGELDWIVHKCLEKDRERRYETANGLARDVQRYLIDEPVEARPVSTRYRLLKFYRRNRRTVWAASFVILSLLGGIVGTTWGLFQASAAQAEEAKQKLEAQKQTLKAEEQTRLAEAVNKFLIEDLLAQGIAENQGSASPRLGRNFPIGSIVDRAARQIQGKFTPFPAVDAELHFVLGQVYANLGEYAVAQPFLERAWRLKQDLYGKEDLNAIETQSHLAALFAHWCKYNQAEPLMIHALEVRTRQLGEQNRYTARSIAGLGWLRQEQGRIQEAALLHHKALDIRQQILDESDHDTINSISNVGWLLVEQGKPQEAAVRFTDALTRCEKKYGVDHFYAIIARHNLAWANRLLNRLPEAESLSIENLKICKQVYGDRHPFTMHCLNNLGRIRLDQRKMDEAEQLSRQALELRQQVLGIHHPDTLVSLNNLAHLLQLKGDLGKAEQMFHEALTGQERCYGEIHDKTAAALNNLGMVKRMLDKSSESYPLLLRALVADERLHGPDHPHTVNVRRNLAETCIDLKRLSEAEEHFNGVLRSQRKTLKPDDFDLAYTLFLFGILQKHQEKYIEAEKLLKECLHIGHTRAPNDWRPFNTRRHLGETLVKLKKYDEAEPILKLAYDGLTARITAIPPMFRASRDEAGTWLINLYEAAGKQEKADEWKKKVQGNLNPKP